MPTIVPAREAPQGTLTDLAPRATRRLNEEFPTFDDDWVASAQNREPSAAELEARELADWKRQRRAWRRHVVRRTFGTIVLLGLVVGFAWFVVSANRQTAEPVALDLGGGVQHAFIFEEPTLQPTNGRRLLPEVTPANPSASHAFVSTNDDGTTVRYDPCRPGTG